MRFEQYIVKEIADESGDVRTFRLQKADGSGLPAYQPGHFFLLRLPDENGKPCHRPYSAASHPSEPCLAFCIKRKGHFPEFLWKLQKGSLLEVDGPYGIFLLLPSDTERVFIGGGVGISALRSMILQTIKEEKPCYLFHSARSVENLIYIDEMKKLADSNLNFKFYPTLTCEELPDGWAGRCGRISAEMLRGMLGGLEGRTFYLCGSKEMAGQLAEALMAAGVPKEKVRKDEWG